MVSVRSVRMETLIAREARPAVAAIAFDAIHNADDVRARLPLNIYDHGRSRCFHADCITFSMPSVMVATSDKRTGEPFR